MHKDIVQIFRMIITQSSPILDKRALDKRCYNTSHVQLTQYQQTKNNQTFRNWKLPDRFGIGKGREAVAREKEQVDRFTRKHTRRVQYPSLVDSSPSTDPVETQLLRFRIFEISDKVLVPRIRF